MTIHAKGRKRNIQDLHSTYQKNNTANAGASQKRALSIFKKLNTVLATSTLKEEKTGVVEDQEPIAIGRFNTATANILIEYGYIYESQYQDKQKREDVIALYALKTFEGLEDFFKGASTTSLKVQ